MMAHNGFVPRPGFAARGGFGRGGFGRPGFGRFGFGDTFGFRHGPFADGAFFHHHHCFSPFCGGFFFPGSFGFNFGFNFGGFGFGFGFGDFGFGFGFGGFGPFGYWGPSAFWPPIYPDYYYLPPPPTVVEVPPQPAYADPNLTSRVDELSNEVAQLRAQQQASNNPVTASSAAEPEATTTLVFRDGTRRNVTHYAIVDGTMWIFDSQSAEKIPLSSIDIDTTRSVNDARGVTFDSSQR
jgi:hypothetical protein